MAWYSRVYRQLKNRRVIRAAIIYLAVFWLLLQVADVLAGSALISEDLVRWIILAGTIGFPLSLILSWFWEHPWHQREGLRAAGDLALIAAITVATALLAWQQWQGAFKRPVIAVLPFEPTDLQPGTRAMSHHLSGRLRMLLAALPDVRVLEPHSSRHERLVGLPLDRKAEALGADYLLSGTVNQTRLNIRVNIQLFDAQGGLVWNESFRDRVIDQYHLQNAILEGLWKPLQLDRAELLRIREILQSCEYPADRDLVVQLAESGLALDTPGGLDQAGLESQVSNLDQLGAGINEAGLIHLLRARARLDLLDRVDPVKRPVIQQLIRQDLEEAFFLCPVLPDVERLLLQTTKLLQSEDTNQIEILERHPNDAWLLNQLALIASRRGDAKMADRYWAEACILNPLVHDGPCP